MDFLFTAAAPRQDSVYFLFCIVDFKYSAEKSVLQLQCGFPIAINWKQKSFGF